MTGHVDDTTVHELMAELDGIVFTDEPNLGRDSHWRPQSSRGKEIFKKLTAPENRSALNEWYSQFREDDLNPSARMLKSALESAIGSKLVCQAEVTS